ncbi:MAG: hypothetical protein Kow0027_20830 [Saprospiraceae bacterium]
MPLTLQGQEVFSYTYGLKDGLPYQEVVSLCCTESGVLWVRSASGEFVSRFDGVNWEHFNVAAEGMPAYMNLLGEDSRGDFWMDYKHIDQTFLARYHHPTGFSTYKFEPGFTCEFDKERNIICFDSAYASFIYDASRDTFLRMESPAFAVVPGFFSGGTFYTIDSGKVTQYLSSNNEVRLFWRGKELERVPNALYQHPLLIFDYNDVIYLDLRQLEYYRYSNGKKTSIPVLLPNGAELVPKYVILLREGPFRSNRSGRGLVCEDPATGALYMVHMEANGKPGVLIPWLPKEAIFTATQDLAGNWWLGTNSGIMYLKPDLLTFDDDQPGMVNGLFSIGEDSEGNIWMGGHEGPGGFSVFDGYKLRYENFGEQSLKILPGSVLGPSGHLFFSTASTPRRIISIKNGEPIFQRYSKDGIDLSAFYFTSLRNDHIAIGSVNIGLVLAEDSSGWLTNIRVIDEDKGLNTNDVGTVTEDLAGRLWLGRLPAGMALYDPAKDTVVNWARQPGDNHTLGIMSSCLDEKGTLWLGAHNGLYFLENAHTFDYHVKDVWKYLTPLPLPGNDQTVVHSLKNTERFLSIGTERALYLLDKTYPAKRPRIFTLEFEKDINGGGAEQNAVWYDSKGYLWLGTQEGATRLDIDNLKFDTLHTNLFLQDFRAGGESFDISENDIGSLPRKKRAVSFAIFAEGNYFLRDNLKFDVLVVRDGKDTIYQKYQTAEKAHSIPYLPPGDYTLQLTAYKHNVVVGQNGYRFAVPTLLTENPWFYGAMAMLLIGLPAMIIIQKKRNELKLEQARRESDSLRILALSNFFNPHFINNSLHWVQSRYRKDPETATIIGRLSDNVHILYENTQKARPWHSLYRELEVVKNYLRIQQVRFGRTLNAEFSITLSDEELKSVKVPAMLLQIHTENAVEKGIRNRKGAGNFFLGIKCTDDGCSIVIEDDGRGRRDTDSPRKGSTFVMNELIELFNNYNEASVTVEYDDFIFGEYGTRVRIFIPKHFNYELSKTENTRR